MSAPDNDDERQARISPTPPGGFKHYPKGSIGGSDVPPSLPVWAMFDCKACEGSGLNSKREPCRICVERSRRAEKCPHGKNPAACLDCEVERGDERTAEEAPEADSDPLYASLRDVLDRAYAQASSGKGKERHANGDAFEDQLIVQIGLHQGGSIDFNTGQACKKSFEAKRLPRDAAVAELLGAINYLAGAIIILENQP